MRFLSIYANIFVGLGSGFYKDKDKVYYYDRWGEREKLWVVQGYDTPTLAAAPNGFLADKDYFYYNTTKLFQNKDMKITKKTVPCNKEYNTGVRIMVIGVAYINVPNENIKILHNDNNVTIIISLTFNLIEIGRASCRERV